MRDSGIAKGYWVGRVIIHSSEEHLVRNLRRSSEKITWDGYMAGLRPYYYPRPSGAGFEASATSGIRNALARGRDSSHE